MNASLQFKDKYKEDNLLRFYNTKISHKASPGIDRVSRTIFENKIEENLKIIGRKVTNGSYRFIPYKEKLISKGRDKFPRVISIPSIRDKVTIGVLNEILTSAFSNQIKNELTQNIVDNVKKEINSNNYNYFIKIDIKGFYDNIDHNILLKNVSKKIKKIEIVDLIKKAIQNPTIPLGTKKNDTLNIRGVPQGISISNILANIFLLDVDKKFSNKQNIRYFRYVDDILILCDKKGKNRIFNSIKRDLCDKLFLSLNDKKDEGDISKGFDYLGYKYTSLNKDKSIYGFTVKEKSIKKLEGSLIKIFCEYKNTNNSEIFLWKINLRITGFILEKNKYGWLFFYSQIDDVPILYHLDWFVSEMCKTFKVNPALQNNIKKFVRAYFEIVKKRAKSQYIPRTENIPPSEQRRVLINVYKFKKETIDSLTDEQILKMFKGKLYIAVKELEQDVQSFS
ncbi:reverse transcriptase domain-containing protein [Paenibacillus sp. FSL H8-0261]|uniref:reverse transcriptase domain-containing protein n=1 Tax=Paenibacillus sp. FSL H8-0261 TaxID=2921381 RepID=UPI00324458DF